MGIKNIHIVLISASAFMSAILGVWGIGHEQLLIGIAAIVFSVALLLYGFQFLKKAATL